ncbi:MAG: heterodisulfide reductase-related iron-sulfur binding cluster [Bacillota bacterium]|nr:heterodisulfide reductase-related iron-sulfur binding cluster [Bacillota bacterium]
MNEYLKQFDNCLQHERSFCSAACPFNLDVNTFVARLQEGRFNAAYKVYRDATGFPHIAQNLCPEPCKSSCLRHAVSGEGSADPIELLKLEEACLAYAKRKDPTNYNIPSKRRNIAIIGAGISGMACALRMATKKYNVTIYEASNTTGGMLLDILDYDEIQEEFSFQMQHLEYKLNLNKEIESIEEVIELGYEEAKADLDPTLAALASVMRSSSINAHKKASETYDAIYVATGEGGNTFGYDLDQLAKDNGGPCTLIGTTAIFFGGSLLGSSPAFALADGLRTATAMDNYIMTKVLNYPVSEPTGIAIDETALVRTRRIVPSQDSTGQDFRGVYTQAEATTEAKRCMRCQCNACRLHCDLTEYLHKWPLRLKDEVIATTAPGKSELHATPAVRTINTCTHCGLCKDVCPENIDMDGLFQSARIRMHKLDKMPWAFNDFFIRDLMFTNSDVVSLCKPGPGAKNSDKISMAFYPGCQLGASSPDLIVKSYDYLLNIDSSTGIMLGCCGVPARWAGMEDLHHDIISKIRSDWKSLGRPIVVLACPTCKKTFAEFLPEIETIFLYDIMAEHGLDDICDADRQRLFSSGNSGESEDCLGDIFSVFDPCATSSSDQVRTSIRSICDQLHISLEPLPLQEKWSACCSYGGHGQLADPNFTQFVRQRRIDEGENPYITYCINCRDAFLHEGKSAVHILDLVFGTSPTLDTVTKRRENRIYLKEQLMKDVWNETLPDQDIAKAKDSLTSGESASIVLSMDNSVRQKLSEEFILEQEAGDVVSFCERTGRTLYNEDSDSYTGYRKIGNLTYWVEYRKPADNNCYELLNAYSHRMEIELEMVWNGEKIEIDM